MTLHDFSKSFQKQPPHIGMVAGVAKHFGYSYIIEPGGRNPK
jgi:hypothetical protein